MHAWRLPQLAAAAAALGSTKQPAAAAAALSLVPMAGHAAAVLGLDYCSGTHQLASASEVCVCVCVCVWFDEMHVKTQLILLHGCCNLHITTLAFA